MRLREVDDTESYINDLLTEVGVIEDAAFPVYNMTWMSRIHGTADSSEQEQNKRYLPYPVKGLPANKIRKDIPSNSGLNDAFRSKVLISAREFERIGVQPKSSDRLVIDGIVFDVGDEDGDIRPIRYGRSAIMYVVSLLQVPSTSNTTPDIPETLFFEGRSSALSTATAIITKQGVLSGEVFITSGATGVINSYIAVPKVPYPAQVVGTKSGSFNLVSNKTLIITVGGVQKTITITSYTYTVTTLLSSLNAKFKTAFGEGVLTAFNSEGFLGIQSVSKGVSASFIIDPASTLLALIGIDAGTYTGYEK